MQKPQMATARSGVFEALPQDESRTGEFIQVAPQMRVEDIATEVLSFLEARSQKNLEDAEVIVAGGRGCGRPAGFQLLQELADVLGGTVGASRKAVKAVRHSGDIRGFRLNELFRPD